MKKITNYFASTQAVKKQKVNEVDASVVCVSNNEETASLSCDNNVGNGNSELIAPRNINNSGTEHIPECWDLEKKLDFCNKYDWLVVENKKLGCRTCKEVGDLGTESTSRGMNISQQWVSVCICATGENKCDQMLSLRKKIFKHKESLAHKAALKILSTAKLKTLETACTKAFDKEKEVTANVFRTAYKVAKKNQAFHDFESEVDVQELNGINMGRILHSTNACVNIVSHIAVEMRSRVMKHIVDIDSKISLLIDESTTISKLSSLILYVRTVLPEMNEPVNIFLDIIELEDVTAKGIFHSLMTQLRLLGFKDEFLKRNLVAVATDGAAVMLGRKQGVVTLIKEQFPDILLWHCANHRLELSVADVVSKDFPTHVNHFKSFLDKLYTIYHQSPKNARELKAHAEELDTVVLKIGRVLDTRWVASSYRTVSAVWRNFEVLVEHFKSAKDDHRRDKTEQSMYGGLLKKITNVNFILDLALMCDALQELAELSIELQARDITIYSAYKKICNQIKVFAERKTKNGPFYTEALQAESQLMFKGIRLEKDAREKRNHIEAVKFYECLEKRMENRLLTSDDCEIPEWARVLDSATWPENPDVTYGETEVKNLCRRFKLPERQILRGFREYLTEKKCPSSLLPLFNTMGKIPISTSECERGFSQMNLIMTPTRASLHLKTVTNLMFIKLVGPPLTLFKPMVYVNSWFLKGRHLATDTKSKERKREDGSDNPLLPVWKLL